MLLSVTAAEDIDRIRPEDVDRLTRNTFLGPGRVLRQIEACRRWPRAALPENYGDPVRSNVPVLILSGEFDPVTPPKWGEICADNLPNSIHIVAPGAHGVGGKCIDSIVKQLLDLGTIKGLNTSCVQQLRLPPFELPADSQ